MIGKTYHVLAALALAAMVAVGGFAAYLYGTGRLNAARVDLLAAVLRGELDAPPVVEAPPAPAPETQPVDVESATSMDKLASLRQAQHLRLLETERAARDLEAQSLLLKQVLQHVLEEQDRLATSRSEFATQREAALDEREQRQQTALDAGFRKELETLEALQPRQAKEHLVRVWQKQPADAARLLGGMEEGRRKRVLEQFKTPEELAIMSGLLEQVRLQTVPEPAEVSRRTAGATTP